jgi:PTS system nitrogen regulatory IIA component
MLPPRSIRPGEVMHSQGARFFQIISIPRLTRRPRRRRCQRPARAACHEPFAILPASNVLVNVDATSKKRVFAAGRPAVREPARHRPRHRHRQPVRPRAPRPPPAWATAWPFRTGRIKGLKNPLAAGAARAAAASPFDAPDDEPVPLLIFLLVPEAATQRHLEILSEIAEMLSRPRAARAAARPSPTPAALHQLISDWQPLKSVA